MYQGNTLQVSELPRATIVIERKWNRQTCSTTNGCCLDRRVDSSLELSEKIAVISFKELLRLYFGDLEIRRRTDITGDQR